MKQPGLSHFADLEKEINKMPLSDYRHSATDKKSIKKIIDLLDTGELRVVQSGAVQIWIKKAILHYFKIQNMSELQSGIFRYHDKIPLKKWNKKLGVRAVPGSIVRMGAFIEPGVILMPSFVNIGARIGAGSLVDTWATVGSCAQIGRNVHLSGGVGIGGVLEPVQASPVIIEDDVFVGSRCIVVEGVHVKKGAVLGAGLILTSSTRIIDTSSGKEFRGSVPENSVVIPGSTNKTFQSGTYGVPVALILGTRKESTDKKTSLNAALREFGLEQR